MRNISHIGGFDIKNTPYMQIDYLLLLLIGFRMEHNLYKWLSFVCPLGLARPDVKFNKGPLKFERNLPLELIVVLTMNARSGVRHSNMLLRRSIFRAFSINFFTYGFPVHL